MSALLCVIHILSSLILRQILRVTFLARARRISAFILFSVQDSKSYSTIGRITALTTPIIDVCDSENNI